MKNNHEVEVLSTKVKNMKNKTLIKLALISSLALSLQADYTRDATKNVVTDNSSGLMWQDDGIVNKTWYEAISYCEGLTFGDYEDWRLPNFNELNNLADRSRANPTISPVFTSIVSDRYWTSTTYASATSDAGIVDFSNGFDFWNAKTYSVYVRCVRGGI